MSNVKKYSRSADGSKKISENFLVREFACKDGSDYILIDDELVSILQQIRTYFGKVITINSGYRNAAYNTKVGGANNSYHTKGMAADIVVGSTTIKDVAAYCETLGVRGIIRYDTLNFVHVDTRPNKYWAKQVGKTTTTMSTFGGVAIKDVSTLQATGIKNLQSFLNAYSGSSLVVDGKFGPMTKKMTIKAIQKNIGVSADGVWGEKSKKSCPILRKGSKGLLVYLLQGLLYCRGYVYSGFDGDYGVKTENEIKSYQTENNLISDGITGKSTFTSLLK